MFLSGSLDKKVRLWSVPDKAVLEQRDVGGFVTALAFAAHGNIAIAATYGTRLHARRLQLERTRTFILAHARACTFIFTR